MIDNTYTVYDIDITCINYKYLCKTPKGYSSLNIYIFFPLLPNIESSPSGDLYGFLRGLRRCPGGQSCHLSSLKSNFSYSFRQFLWNVRFFFSTNKNRQKGCCLKKDVFVFLHFFPLGFESHYLDEAFVLRMVFVVFFASTWHCFEARKCRVKKVTHPYHWHYVKTSPPLREQFLSHRARKNWKWYNSRVFWPAMMPIYALQQWLCVLFLWLDRLNRKDDGRSRNEQRAMKCNKAQRFEQVAGISLLH